MRLDSVFESMFSYRLPITAWEIAAGATECLCAECTSAETPSLLIG